MAAQEGLLTHSAGAFLKEARINSKISLSEASAYLRINIKYLKLIEDSCYEDLPGPTYAIGFIRSYAEYLGVDAKSLIDQYKEETANLNVLPGLEFPLPANIGWFPSGKIVLICVFFSLFALVGWFILDSDDLPSTTEIPLPPGYKTTNDRAESKQNLYNAAKRNNVKAKEDIISYKPPKPENLRTNDSNKERNLPKTSSNKTLIVALEDISPKPKELINKNIKDEKSKPNPSDNSELLKNKKESAIGRTYGKKEKNSRIVIVAESDSWVQVIDNKKNVIMSRMFRAGDRYNVPNKSDLTLLTGNAGGLKFLIDGKSVPKIGADGTILNNVQLDIELLKQGMAVN